MHILHTVFHTFPKAYEENLFSNQELLQLAIVSVILEALMFDSGVML